MTDATFDVEHLMRAESPRGGCRAGHPYTVADLVAFVASKGGSVAPIRLGVYRITAPKQAASVAAEAALLYGFAAVSTPLTKPKDKL